MGRAKGMTKNAWAWFNYLGERIMRFGNSISLSLSLFAVTPLIGVSKVPNFSLLLRLLVSYLDLG